MTKKAANTFEAIGPEVTNGAVAEVEIESPYVARITVEGTAPFLFHRWSVEGVEAKSKAAKNSAAKKSDNVESYVYRDEHNHLAIPGEYFRMAIVNAAKFKQDPRSPRKSAMDLFKAGIAVLDEYCSLGTAKWDFLDRRRVKVQMSAITRERPAMRSGWVVTAALQVLLPEYISPQLLNAVVQDAGRLIGVGDFRPSMGRFIVTSFKTEDH